MSDRYEIEVEIKSYSYWDLMSKKERFLFGGIITTLALVAGTLILLGSLGVLK